MNYVHYILYMTIFYITVKCYFFRKGKTYYATTYARRVLVAAFHLPRNLIGHSQWRISIELGRTCRDATW